jgi:hypothetical protein
VATVLLPFALCFLLGACHHRAERDRVTDDRAIAEVEAAQRQKPPTNPIAPEAILSADLQAGKIAGAGCAFAPDTSTGPILLAKASTAYLKLDGHVVRLASDPGSTPMPLGTWSHYTGKAYAARLESDGDVEPNGADKSVQGPGRLTVTDPYDQVIYQAAGSVQCGS